jgi:DNA-binding response OmpR family regulator
MNEVKNILIAEDEKPMAHALELKLKQVGFNPTVASNGEATLLALDKTNFSLILLDLVMPKISGYDVLKIIREKKINVPIIILSNLSQSEEMEKANKMGVEDYFNKTDISLNEIVKRVKQILDK